MRIRSKKGNWARLKKGLSINRHHVSKNFYPAEEKKADQAVGLRPKYIRNEKVSGIGPWVWLEGETGAWEGPSKEFEALRSICLENVKKRDMVVTAGGCLGLYPRLWAESFDHVTTAEPCPENFEVMRQNCVGDKFTLIEAAFGEADGYGELYRSSAVNVGMHSMAKHRINNFDKVPVRVVAIDDLDLAACDLLQLDAEEWEPLIMRGAMKTIKKYWPVIVVETATDEMWQFFKANGYREVKRLSPDIVFVHS